MTVAYELTKFGLQMVGWGTIPRLLSKRLLNYIYGWYPKLLGRSPPAPGSPEHQKHTKWAYAAVVFGYALFTFNSAANDIEKNYYELLGVEPTADDADLKAAFRVFAKKYHPDRAGPEAETYFMQIRTVFDALKKPSTRFAYDRFGPDVLEWKNTTTTSEYFKMWLWMLVPNYLVTIFVVFFFNAVVPHSLVFWNYILVLGTLALELLLVLSPSPQAPVPLSSVPLSSVVFSSPIDQTYVNIFTYLWPRRVAYQHILLIRQLSLLLSSALQNVIPHMFPSSTPQDITEESVMEYLRELMRIIARIDQEVLHTLHASIHSAHGRASNSTPSPSGFADVQPMEIEPPVTERLLKELQDMVLENVLLGQQGPLRSACESALLRKKRTLLEQRQREYGHAHPHTVTGGRVTGVARRTGGPAALQAERKRDTSGGSAETLVDALLAEEDNSTAQQSPVEILDHYLASGSLNAPPLVPPHAAGATGSRPEYVRARSQSL